ncbi:MAG TPA: phosphoenolpyruvate--protein phosphotransferase [Candidatus Competibacteraceae bacterium]|nr:phosphoenolpyruvate--protein phosphotransferase [Candidatus Competibacteraceae bacterium]MCP5132777.1 phosphoenolpyruvate--protein phosphotransferase [Gammaproteobacteria bacterium]HPF57590.1 phosphoenolpyruvate--protein phosphotransferase [Candidatus Competibacteraceae bacterium]HRY16889.1 phosphoenolpyruvate--protein phosphotransferase [Candidatus Competibacteraceae bacterium]
MLATLRRIVQDVSTAPDLPSALAITVNRIRDTMSVAACTIYLADEDNREYVLTATAGLNPQAVGRIRLSHNQGLVSLVAERQEPLNLEDAHRHPRFYAVPEAGEENYHAFLGVPLIQYRRVLGMLTVQHTATRLFHLDEVDFLVTIAAQLASILNHAILSGATQELLNPSSTGTRALQGVAGAPGIAIGTITIPYLLADLDDVPDRPALDPVAEKAAFQAAIAAVEQELHEAADRLAPLLPPTELALFTVYRMMLSSDSLLNDTLDRIQTGRWAPAAWRDAISSRVRLLGQAEDPYLSTRAEDIRDLGRRVLNHLRAEPTQSLEPAGEHCILVAEEMSVAHLAAVPLDRLAGIVCLRGSALSHVALLARAMGIPAVLGLGDRPLGRFEGTTIIIDGYQGRVYLNPDAAVREEYQQLIVAEAELTAELRGLREQPAITRDGYRIPLYAKAGLLTDIAAVTNSGADGVGLYRTEFSFMVRESFPSEDEQYQIYQQMLTAFAPQPVVMRTLDIGGDKTLPYFRIEENNPFLGWRGMRFTLDHPDIFLIQLRAMLRANAGLDNLRILFPMITTVEEVDEALRLLERAHQELCEDSWPAARPEIGVMIEIPSAAWQARQLAQRADFLAVGTNDLTQYLLAVDRDNARVAGLYDNLHPSMLKAIAHIIAEGHKAGRPVNLCGEMAGDPGAAVLLLGMGVDSLSAGPVSVPKVKWAIRSFTLTEARSLAQQAIALETVSEVRQLLSDALRQAGLGEIVRKSV